MIAATAETDLWADFRADRSTINRNCLLEHYMPLVQQVAAKLARRLHGVDAEDLVQVGVVGLIDAIER